MNTEEYKEYLESVSPYNTLQEKNAVLLTLDNNTKTPLDFANALEISPKPSNNLEAVAMIFQARKKSVGEDISITMTCNDCKFMSVYPINIDSLFFRGNLHTDIPIKIVEDIFEIDLDIDDLSLEEANILEDKIHENNKNIFSPIVNIQCRKCQKVNTLRIKYQDILSKFTIKNIYEQYLDITRFTSMNKKDVDDMPPYEREIFIGLIQEKENKNE